MSNQDYKNAALAALKGNWAPAVVATIVYIAIAMAIGLPYSLSSSDGDPSLGASALYMLGSIFVLLPLGVGIYNAFRLLVNNGDANIASNMFREFNHESQPAQRL